jgi:hypothetical protein
MPANASPSGHGSTAALSGLDSTDRGRSWSFVMTPAACQQVRHLADVRAWLTDTRRDQPLALRRSIVDSFAMGYQAVWAMCQAIDPSGGLWIATFDAEHARADRSDRGSDVCGYLIDVKAQGSRRPLMIRQHRLIRSVTYVAALVRGRQVSFLGWIRGCDAERHPLEPSPYAHYSNRVIPLHQLHAMATLKPEAHRVDTD